MPINCAVIGCGNKEGKPNTRFFTIPAPPKRRNIYNERKCKLLIQRRLAWLQALRRKDMTQRTASYTKICSDHFIAGRPSALEDKNNPDWVPSVMMCKVKKRRKSPGVIVGLATTEACNSNGTALPDEDDLTERSELKTDDSYSHVRLEDIAALKHTFKEFEICRKESLHSSKKTPLGKIYADYNATTPMATEVIDAISASLKEGWGNPSSDHYLGQRAKAAIELARGRVAKMVGGLPEQITFASGGTEVNNMVIFGLCVATPDFIPHVVTSDVEHDSIDLPLRHLEKTGRAKVTRVKVRDGQLRVEDVMTAIRNETVLVTIMTANNETGVIMPIREIGATIKTLNARRGRPRIFFHSDGAQILGKHEIDVNQCNLDCFTIVGHKFYGPRIGALWSRVQVPPLLFGGGQEGGVRPGTENTPMIIGLGVAAQLVTDNIHSYKKNMGALRLDLEERLINSQILKGRINCGKKTRLLNTVNVSFPYSSITGSMILNSCSRLLAGVGAACHSSSGSSKVLLRSGVPPELAATAVRLSLGRDMALQQVKEIVEDLENALLSLSHLIATPTT